MQTLIDKALKILESIYDSGFDYKLDIISYYVLFALEKEGINIENNERRKINLKESSKMLLNELYLIHKEILRTEPQDVLGIFLMGGNKRGKKGYAGNSYNGQFFTEKEVCESMAELSFIKLMSKKKNYNRKNPFKILEPSSGSGAMVLSLANVIKKNGYYISETMDITAVELDSRTSYMLLLQLKLANLNARVIHGNSITGEIFKEWNIKSDEVITEEVEEDDLEAIPENQKEYYQTNLFDFLAS